MGASGLPGTTTLADINRIQMENLGEAAQAQNQFGRGGNFFSSGAQASQGAFMRQGLRDVATFNAQLQQQDLQNRINAATALGNLGTTVSGQKLQAELPIMQTALTAGGATSAPVIEQKPGFIQGTLLPLVGAFANTVAAFKGGNPGQPWGQTTTYTGGGSPAGYQQGNAATFPSMQGSFGVPFPTANYNQFQPMSNPSYQYFDPRLLGMNVPQTYR